jgi:hypothetical protein
VDEPSAARAADDQVGFDLLPARAAAQIPFLAGTAWMGDIRTMFTAEVSKAASSQSHHSILTAEVKQFESRLVLVSILTMGDFGLRCP